MRFLFIDSKYYCKIMYKEIKLAKFNYKYNKLNNKINKLITIYTKKLQYFKINIFFVYFHSNVHFFLFFALLFAVDSV